MNYNNRLTLILWIFRRNKSVVCQKSFSCIVTKTRKSQAFARLSKLSFSRILFLIATIPHIRFSNLGYKAFIKSLSRGDSSSDLKSSFFLFLFSFKIHIFSKSKEDLLFFFIPPFVSIFLLFPRWLQGTTRDPWEFNLEWLFTNVNSLSKLESDYKFGRR